MPKARSMERKNMWRREETQRVRVERIITGYVKYRHPEIYNKANEFYEHLDEQYPNKKDLRRTNEFEWLKQGTARTMKKFYTRKRKITDNMILHIPLMNQDEIATENTTQPTEIPACQHEIIVETTVESSSNQPEMTKETMVETSTSIPSTTADLPPISDEIIEEIMRGLREDPDIRNFFDDVDFEHDDCPLW